MVNGEFCFASQFLCYLRKVKKSEWSMVNFALQVSFYVIYEK